MDKFKINIYGKKDASGGVEKALSDILDERYWPVTFDMFNADLTFIDIKPGRINLNNGISIESNLHPHPNGALGFRIELKDNIITYVTDVEHPIGNTLRKVNHLARESDVLIHEAHFTPSDLPNYKGWGHCSWEEAVSVAKISNSKQLVLFHHSPTYSDDVINEFGEDAKKNFKNCILAKQNLEIIL
jgi:ribonuclease BN (tRNA processing enzyme)